jgi:hypothetical protein
MPSCLLNLLKPAPGMRNPTDSLLPSFVLSETVTCDPVLSRAGLLFVIPSLGPHGLTPEVLAPVGIIVSPSINTY